MIDLAITADHIRTTIHGYLDEHPHEKPVLAPNALSPGRIDRGSVVIPFRIDGWLLRHPSEGMAHLHPPAE